MIESPISEKESNEKMKRLEKLFEDEISEMAKYVKLKLSFGIDIFSIQLPDSTIELKKIHYKIHITNKRKQLLIIFNYKINIVYYNLLYFQ